MRVAYVVSDLTFPPREGLHQQTVLLLRALVASGVQVEVLGYCRHPELLDLAKLAAEVGTHFRDPPIRRVLPSLIRGLCNRVSIYARSDSRLRRRLDSDEFDVVHLEGAAACGLLRSSYASRTAVVMIDAGSRRRLSLATSSGSLVKRLGHLVLAAMNYCLEYSLSRDDATWVTVSSADRNYLSRRHQYARNVAIPVLVPSDETSSESGARDCAGVAGVVGLAMVDLRQEHLRESLAAFIRDIYRPGYESRELTCSLTVLGRIPPDSHMLAACQGLPIAFLGWVDDYRQTLGRATFIVIPDLVGSGIKNRTVQALALGLPVLGTTVAFQGISAVDGQHAYIYASVAEGRARLTKIASSQDDRHALAHAGKDLARSYAAPLVTAEWLRLYASLAHGYVRAG